MAQIKITLVSTDVNNGNVVLQFQKDAGTVYTRTINSLPTNDPADPVNVFVNAAVKWVLAFYAGQDSSTPPPVSPAVAGLVGQSTSVTV